MSPVLHPAISEDDHTRGDASPGTVLTVFGDYECPVSARLWRVLREMRATKEPFQEAFRHPELPRTLAIWFGAAPPA
jgi:hypothetical protein